RRTRIEQLRNLGKVGVGVPANDARQLRRAAGILAHDHGGGAGGAELTLILQVGKKGNLARAGRLQRADLADPYRALSDQLAAEPGDQLEKRERGTRIRVHHRSPAETPYLPGRAAARTPRITCPPAP